ncbi:hypothetical protein LIER_38112 [Lithospermum erythrorhizon]|uniref:Uncharacterized protein n=1 Tax=Lithospermum erythrorhizon TaxID=34254 RepID=A0AAV3PX04_LITER
MGQASGVLPNKWNWASMMDQGQSPRATLPRHPSRFVEKGFIANNGALTEIDRVPPTFLPALLGGAHVGGYKKLHGYPIPRCISKVGDEPGADLASGYTPSGVHGDAVSPLWVANLMVTMGKHPQHVGRSLWHHRSAGTVAV